MKLAIFAAAATMVAAKQVITWPSSYLITGTISLPYANVTEPFSAYTDFENTRQRIDYYGGIDSYIFRGDLNVTWQVNPEIDALACFTTNGTVSISSFLPDMTGYQYNGQTVLPSRGLVDDWQLVVNNQPSPTRVSTYHMYVDPQTQNPVRLSFLGYDTVLGTHYDEYIFDYDAYVPAVKPGVPPFPAKVFDQPNDLCGAFPGPGVSDPAMDGQGLVNELIPQPAQPGSEGPSEPRKDSHFQAYINEFRQGRWYETSEEESKRHSIFTNNRRIIAATNKRNKAAGKSLRLKMNYLGDATQEEMAPRHGRSLKYPTHKKIAASAGGEYPSNGAGSVHPTPTEVELRALPGAIDWRTKNAVTAVQDQGTCGSCWAHGAAQMLEGQRALKYGILEPLAPQELMDCSWNFGNNACDGGEDFRGYQWVMQNGGLSSKAVYGPYLMQDGLCKSDMPKAVSIQSYVNVTSGSETALQSALATAGPVSISIFTELPSFVFYDSGVFDDAGCINGLANLDHTVLAVGYNLDAPEPYYIVKNSWSTHWGSDGYIWIGANKGDLCGIADAATYAIIN